MPVSRLTPFAAATLSALALLLAWDASGLDLAVAHWAGGSHGFPLREHWLLSTVLHEGGRRAAWLAALALCLGVWWPRGPLARLAFAQRLRLAASTLLAAFAITLMKGVSPASCPWDLELFGGVAHYASHWSLQADGGRGHCFPAGHASSGFAFLGGWFAFRGAHPRVARVWLVAALGIGLAFGLAQQWRGAHFMSHTLWTAWLCWVIAAAVHREPVLAREAAA